MLSRIMLHIYIHSVFLSLHYCPMLIPLYNTSVLIDICRFLFKKKKINKKYIYMHVINVYVINFNVYQRI